MSTNEPQKAANQGGSKSAVRFLLNDQEVSLGDHEPDATLLDFIRLNRHLTGTKEGCAEGDCGACTVLVGRINAKSELVYESVNSCIRFTASLNACHVVTVEHLKQADGSLHPVQQAMVDCHGSQCGFCTPGFVMSLYALWLGDTAIDDNSIEQALQGNLCRCTGYEPIFKAARQMAGARGMDDRLTATRNDIKSRLKSLATRERMELSGPSGNRAIIPVDRSDLLMAVNENPSNTIVAGSTDVGLWVTKHFRDISPAIFINHLTDLQTITLSDVAITFGAGVSYSDAFPVIREHLPEMAPLWRRIGGEQVRNMGTIGGNIANGSPIGDTPPGLIALGARVLLESVSGKRELPLEDFFIEYGKQDRKANEIVASLTVPRVPQDGHLRIYKISKRLDEDISASCGAFLVRLEGQRIVEARICFGGMAGIPKRANHVEEALTGNSWTLETIEAAVSAFEQDFQPLTDWRASAQYRMLTAKNLLRRFFHDVGRDGDETELAGLHALARIDLTETIGGRS